MCLTVLNSDLYPVCNLSTTKPQLCAFACELHPLSLPGDWEELQLIRLCLPFSLLLAFKQWPKSIMPKVQSLGKVLGAFLVSALCLSNTPWKGSMCEGTFRWFLHAAGLVSKLPLSEHKGIFAAKRDFKGQILTVAVPVFRIDLSGYRPLVTHWSLFTALGIDCLWPHFEKSRCIIF